MTEIPKPDVTLRVSRTGKDVRIEAEGGSPDSVVGGSLTIQTDQIPFLIHTLQQVERP